ncbi:MAG: hypothetical protein PHQ66_02145 [Candidatus Nanoarchaeia archaeon]|nr:hypothetical protein [Candidatus Nanoarchaeia archaeon]MDD5357827.1 hypothetical protein [Candidatus Nanoarchaeia archaeon]MDD5588746.1 hypothetical protein [Candidatus Nanoarchaeia archaeon]
MKKINKRKNKFDRFFLLNWKKIFLGMIIWVGAVVLHNLTYAFIIGVLKINIVDEPFFFVIAVIFIPLYFLISIIYTLIQKLRK